MNEILIYSDIGENWFGDGVTAKAVKAQLDEMEGDITIRINSPGGDVFDGFAIYNLLNQHDGKKTVHIDGMAASAASVIAMAGDSITMAENALMMIHDPWTVSVGSAGDMRATADLLDKVSGSIVTTYRAQTDIEEADLTAMMAAETWMNAAEAIEKGFATETTESTATAFNTSKPWINNAPKSDKLPADIETQVAWRASMARRRLALEE
jgi:ATP-dependent Clp protease protease subunit